MRILVTFALLAVGLFIGSDPANAQPPPPDCPGGYPPPERSFTVDKTVVEPGETVHVEGSGFQPGTEVTVTLERGRGEGSGGYAQVLDVFIVDEEGRFEGDVTIPEDVRPGNYFMKARGTDCNGEPLILDARIRVREGGRFQGEQGRLAIPAFLIWSLLGLLVLLLGATPFLVAHRRRRADLT